MRVSRLLTLVIVILLAYYAYDGWFSGKERFIADIYSSNSSDLYLDHVMIIDDGIIKEIRPQNFFDKINFFVHDYSGHIIMPGIINPLTSAQCVVGYETDTQLRLEQWMRSQENKRTLHMANNYDPWITELGEYIGMQSLYVKSGFLQYILTREFSNGETTSYHYPTVAFNAEEISMPVQEYGKAYSYGLRAESGTEIKVKFEESTGPFILHVYSADEIISAHRFGLLSERTILVLHGELNEDAIKLIEFSKSKVIITPDTLTLGRELVLPAVQWGIATGMPCAGTDSIFKLFPELKARGLTQSRIWDKITRVNGEILGLSPRGTLKVGAPADFLIIKTYTIEGISPERIVSVYRDGEKLPISHIELRKKLDDSVRREGKHLGQAQKFGAIKRI